MSNLDSLPASLLERLDAVLPKITEAAIYGEYMHGMCWAWIGGMLMFAGWVYGVLKRGGWVLGAVLATLGFLIFLMAWPSVIAPEAVLAREILTGM